MTEYPEKLWVHMHGAFNTMAIVNPSIFNDQEYIRADLVPGWRTDFENAPQDGTPILVWHVHDSDPYYEEDTNRLTVFGAHFEGMGFAHPDGPCVAVWGGAYHEDVSGEGWGPYVDIPNWWFLKGDDFETPLAPVKWMPIPEDK